MISQHKKSLEKENWSKLILIYTDFETEFNLA